MNKICNTRELFQKAIPTAINPDDYLFQDAQQHLENANRWVRNQFIGEDLYNGFEDLDSDIQSQLNFIVANKAFYDLIPQLDLILTPNGFGIVRTDNVAPASADRVKNLLDRTYRNWSTQFDQLLIQLLTTDNLLAKFRKSPVFYSLTNSFFLTAAELSIHAGIANATREDLEKLAPKISMCEVYLKRKISVEYYEELLSKVRVNALTEADKVVFPQFKRSLGMDLQGNHHAVVGYMDNVMNYIENNPDLYPTYTKSSTFINKSKQYFKNEKDSSGFFFG